MIVNPIMGNVSFQGCCHNQKRKFNKYSLVPATGYLALGAGVVSGALAHQKKIKAHKVTAGIALAAAALHILFLKTLHRFGNNQNIKMA